MRLKLRGHGTLSLNCDWSERGVTQALPFIQQLFKRWDGGDHPRRRSHLHQHQQ